ncbi:MAG: tyrosine-type recombinase/integrase [Elusimicrobiota bacterium]
MAKKVVGGKYEVDFTYKGQRVRGSIPVETLVVLLRGPEAKDGAANLGPQGAIAFDRFVDEYYLPRRAKPHKKETAYASDRSACDWLKRFFGGRPLHLVGRVQREEFKQQRLCGILSRFGKPCATNTVNHDLSCLNQVMEYAVELGHLNENPLAGMKRLPVTHRERFWLTKEKLGRLLEAAKGYEQGRYLDFVEFLAASGARLGEALDFRKEHIDWKRKEIRLKTLKKRNRANAERFLSFKDIGPSLEGVLRRMKAHPRTGYFFASRQGKPWWPRNAGRAFRRIRSIAGLEEFRLHDLRHTFAMHRAMTRITFRQLQVELGHSSPQSVQAYLDQADRFDPRQSIFFKEPAKMTAEETRRLLLSVLGRGER